MSERSYHGATSRSPAKERQMNGRMDGWTDHWMNKSID